MRPRLFLSSTVEDLGPFRDQVVHVAQRLGVEVVAMEEFGPDPRRAVDVCREKVRGADVFLGLYAHRYGFVADPTDGTSLTELEYRWALERGPTPDVLVFLVDDAIPWPPRFVEHGPGWDRLQAFKAELRERHVVESMTTPEQLLEDLFLHLPPFLTRADRPSAPLVPTIPRPPEPWVVHPYSLLQTAGVVGRARESARLGGWLAGDGNPVACVVAIGGMGKSALTWRWFHRQTLPGGRLWWSFYENHATFDRFVTTTLAYLGGRPVHEVEQSSPHDRDQELLALLDERDCLVVLDGLERLLIAYSNLDFAHLTDDDLDERTANALADRMGLPQGFVGRHRLRRTIDVRVGAFLRKLTQVRRGRVLITTRLFPSELQTVAGHALPGVEAWFLRGLDPEDAIALWRELGVSGAEARLRELFATIEHYPLLIRALAGEVAHHRAAPGDLDRWLADHPDFDPFALPLVQAKSHVLAHAVGGLDEQARELLHTLAGFRAPVDHAVVTAMFVARRDWTEQRLDAELTDLEDRGLIGWDRAANSYDLHPIVRGVVWSGLDDLRRRSVYGELERHFSALPAREEALTPEEAQPVIELFTALVGLGRYDDAAALWFQRFHDQMGFVFVEHGMGHINIALLEGLFPDGLDAAPRIESDRSGVLAQLGHAYESAGRLPEAYRLSARADEDRGSAAQMYYTAERAFSLGMVAKAMDLAEAAGEAETAMALESARYNLETPPSYWARAAQAVLLVETGELARAVSVLATLRSTRFFHPGEIEARTLLIVGDPEGALAAAAAARAHFAATEYPRPSLMSPEWTPVSNSVA